MSYAVKEMFLTLQGEGSLAGTAAVFIRFAGCNLWSGREQDRQDASGSCAAWCDTDFRGTDGDGGGVFDTADELAQAAAQEWTAEDGPRWVVLTGGEPMLQVDEKLVTALRSRGFHVAMETNGTIPVPFSVDWLCVSPKSGASLMVTSGDDLKVVFPQQGLELGKLQELAFKRFFLQPVDHLSNQDATRSCVEFCQRNPRWRLSLQTHKLIQIR